MFFSGKNNNTDSFDIRDSNQIRDCKVTPYSCVRLLFKTCNRVIYMITN